MVWVGEATANFSMEYMHYNRGRMKFRPNYQVKEKHTHPLFEWGDPFLAVYDLVLIRLNQSIRVSSANSICLPGSLMKTQMIPSDLRESESEGDSLPKAKPPAKPTPGPQKLSQQPKKPSPAPQKPKEKSDLKPKSPKKGSKLRSKLEVTQQN